MALAEWPSVLPTSPRIEGYSSKPRSSTISFDPDAGRPKKRNRALGMPDDITETYYLDDAGKNALDNFWRNTLSHGTLPFLKKDPESGLIKEYEFVSAPDKNKQGIGWVVTLELIRLQ